MCTQSVTAVDPPPCSSAARLWAPLHCKRAPLAWLTARGWSRIQAWAANGIAGLLNRKPATVRGLSVSHHRESDRGGHDTEMSGEEAAIVSRLTDPRYFTGAHRHRFDEEGRGRGAEGRTDFTEAVNTGGACSMAVRAYLLP